MNKELRKKVEQAVAQQKNDHPLDPNFEYNPDKYRSEKSPPDFVYEGKVVGYYDTQGALWRLGDRKNPLPYDKSFVSFADLVKDLKDAYPGIVLPVSAKEG